MASFGVALPIQRDSADGFRMLKDFRKLIAQNLKMLVLLILELINMQSKI